MNELRENCDELLDVRENLLAPLPWHLSPTIHLGHAKKKKKEEEEEEKEEEEEEEGEGEGEEEEEG